MTELVAYLAVNEHRNKLRDLRGGHLAVHLGDKAAHHLVGHGGRELLGKPLRDLVNLLGKVRWGDHEETVAPESPGCKIGRVIHSPGARSGTVRVGQSSTLVYLPFTFGFATTHLCGRE